MKIVIVLCFSLLFFQSNTLFAQVINNNGAAISVTNGVVVQGDTLENTAGLITNNGTIGLRGHYINIGTTSGNGIYNIAGNWTNTGIFNPGTSTVNFMGNNNQSITSTGGEIFNNLIINNTGASPINRIVLLNNVNVSGTFTFTLGNIETGANKLFLSNQTITSLNYTSVTGSRVIGKFERGINNTGNYLFPIGSDSNYNPLNLNLNITPTAGSVLSEFIDADPGSSGLPLPDVDVEVWEAYDDGYWSLTSTGFSCGDYNINLDGSGFLTPIQDITRIIKRPVAGAWLLDGTHSDAIGFVGYRHNLTGDILTTGNHFGFGRARPLILDHPADTAVCDGESASFSVSARGRFPLSYQWQENRGFGWNDISDAGIYSGTTTDLLQLSTTTLVMNGYQYRVIVTDYHENFNISDAAFLTVNPLPVATATPERDTICNNQTTYIVLTSDVPNTTFALEVVYNGSIIGASTILNVDTIKQTLTNPGNNVDSVIYRIIPTGPDPTYCGGTADTAVVLVNPTPNIIPLIDAERICNNGQTGITLTTPTTLTDGIVTFDYTAISTGAPGDLTGYTASDAGLINNDRLIQTLTNSTDTIQSVIYTITPRALETGCDDGPFINVEVKVHPRPIDTVIITSRNSCFGNAEGSLDLILAKGTGPFEIIWDGPNQYRREGIEDIDSLFAGLYYVQVTDFLGCIANDTSFIDAPLPILGSIGSPTKPPLKTANISCIDGSDGEVYFRFGDGIYPPYNYWFINPEGDTIDTGTDKINLELIIVDSLPKGMYKMIVQDDAGCYNSWQKTLTEPDPINVGLSSPVYFDPYNISCNGYNDGSIKVDTVYGGNGNYTYFWTGSITGDPTGRDQSNLIAGTYYLEITDTLGCISTDSIILIEPDGIELIDSVLSVTADGNYNISCYGGNDGSIDLTLQGGSGEYAFEWTGPVGSGIDPTAEDQSGITAGSYNVQVTDESGCGKSYSFELTEPVSLEISSILSVSIDGNFNINCSGGNEGDIDITVSGGSVGNYSYHWATTNGSGLTETDEDQSGLTAGTYNVIVTDLNGCTIERTYELTEPEPLETSIVRTDITCDPGYDDGMADLTVTGGMGPGTYSFVWSNGETTEDIYGLVEGIYVVTVTDANNCTIKDSVRMNLPPPLILSVDSISAYNDLNISCYGYMDGLIHTSVISGTPSYNYSWTGPGGFISSDSVIVNLGAGIYNLHVVDSRNCMGDTTIELTEPDSLIMVVRTSGSLVGGYNLNCNGDNNATIDLEISGGTPEYIYSWTTGEVTASLSMLEAGNYAVVV